MKTDVTMIFGKREGGCTAFNISRICRSEGKEWERFQKLDKEWGHSLDLVYALDNDLVQFLD